MSLRPLIELIETLRASLKTLEDTSAPGQDGPALAEQKSTLRLRIHTLECALRRATELPSSRPPNKEP
jgi:hypothetical protein